MPSNPGGRSWTARAALAVVVAVLSPSAARADWMLSGFLGGAKTQSSSIDLSLPAQGTQLQLGGVEYRGESFHSPQYYGVRLTRTVGPWLGIEGEFIHAKVFAEVDRDVHATGTRYGAPISADVRLSSVVQRLSMSHGLNFILVNVAARRGFGPANASGAHRIVGVVRAGAGPTMPHAESHLDNETMEQYEGGGLGVQVGGGVELALGHGVGALGEYKFTEASPEIDVAGGTAKIPSRTHHFVFGVLFKF
jgi:opacity protein-like surface antigen